MLRRPRQGTLANTAALIAGLATLATVSLLDGFGIRSVASGVAASYAARGLMGLAATHERTRQWRVTRLGVLADVAVAATLVAAAWLQSWAALVPFFAAVALLATQQVGSRRLARQH